MNTKIQTRCGIVVLCVLTTGWLVLAANAEEKQNKTVTQTLPLRFTSNVQEGKPAIPQQAESLKQASYPALTKSELKIQGALDAKTEGNFPNVHLSDVMAYFQNLHGVNIFLDSQALKEQGLTADEPVNISFKGISLKLALNLILNPMGLDYVVDHEVLKITTAEEVAHTFRVRIYPVADLCNSPEDYEALEKVIDNTCLAKRQFRSKSYPVDDLVVGGAAQKKVVRVNHFESISSVPQCRALVINDTDRVHEKIVTILTQLREVRQDQEGLSTKK